MRSCNIMLAAVLSFCDLSAINRRWFVANAARPKNAATAAAIRTSARVKAVSLEPRVLQKRELIRVAMEIISTLGAREVKFTSCKPKRYFQVRSDKPFAYSRLPRLNRSPLGPRGYLLMRRYFS